ncbi:MAG: RDD family protein [Hahellaceae bacterium]|nr:RDD family protein [Hahellaceae bacterium]MCP5213231.1 RDD family protein [Hahellaceae bacterium]
MLKQFPEPATDTSPAPLIRRLTAMLYDSLIVIALMMMTTGIYKATQAGIIGADKLRELTESGKMDTDPLLSSILFIVLYVFFAYFWTRSGQTLGMQVWHIRVQSPSGTSISWSQALLRFMMAAGCFFSLVYGFILLPSNGPSIIAILLIAAGTTSYLWVLIDKKKRSWHDIFSMTEVVRIPKRKAE